MATTDIDPASIVGKYVSRQTTGTRLNADADTATENEAVLESIAIAMLLNPQAVLSIILNAKNTLQQLISADLELITYIIGAIGETQNPTAIPTSTADLVDAQTALVELDRVGRVDTSIQAFTRYQNSIGNFLNNQLAPLVKRSPTGEFNRSGLEAKQDLFNSVSLFTQTHQLFIANLAILANAVTDYNSVDLSAIVSSQTIARVRTSLQQIQAGATSGQMSNTVQALELMAGSASLQAISNAKKVYDDTIPLTLGLSLGPEPTSAFIQSHVGPNLSTTAAHPHSISLSVDGGAFTSAELPYTGRSGAPYVCNSLKQTTYNIPTGYHLYIDVTPGPSPDAYGVTHYDVTLTSGSARTNAQVIADINAEFAGSGPLAADLTGAGDLAIVILGRTSDTVVHVLAQGPGSFDTGSGIFTPSPPTANAILGFDPNHTSLPVDTFDIPFLMRFFRANFTGITVSQTLDDRLEIESNSTDPAASRIAFDSNTIPIVDPIMTDFGFTDAGAIPLAMLLTDGSGVAQDPVALGVLQGSVFHAGAFIQTLVSIDGSRLLFDPTLSLPSRPKQARVVAPVVVGVQNSMVVLSLFDGQFDNDIVPLQGLLSPLLTTPSLAQVNDAVAAFVVIEMRLTDVFNQLTAIVVTEAQEPVDATAQSILQTLEERGLDQAFDFMSQCRFSDFFALTSETASKSTSFMKSMETVVTTDLPTSTVEEDSPDGNLVAGSSPSSVLTDKEVP